MKIELEKIRQFFVPKPRRIVHESGLAKVRWFTTVRYPDGSIKYPFTDEGLNLIVNAGKDDHLDVYFRSGTQTATASWYLIPTNGSPSPAATDTLATHAGWTEFSSYVGNRPAWGQDAVSGQSITNSTAVTITCNADTQTMGGCGLCTVNTGTAGTLFSVSAFSGNKSLDTNDTIDITVTVNA